MTKFGNNTVFKRAVNLPNESIEVSSIQGVGLKTIILLLITLVSALISMKFIKYDDTMNFEAVFIGYIITPIITFFLSMIMSFRPKAAKILSIPYAVLEGLTVGCLSGILMIALGGNEASLLLGLALLITIAIFMAGAFVYSTGLIKVTSGFRRFMSTLLIGLILSSLIIGIMSIFSESIQNLFYGNTSLSLLISIITVIIASVYTIISLDNAKKVVDGGLDKVYEWYAAFGIILNIIWLFYEIVRLLLVIFSRANNN